MIQSVRFVNFKALRDTALPLGRITLLVGPNGSGKSSALDAFRAIAQRQSLDPKRILSLGAALNEQASPEVVVDFAPPNENVRLLVSWRDGAFRDEWQAIKGTRKLSDGQVAHAMTFLQGLRHYAFDPANLAGSSALKPNVQLNSQGQNLAAVLDQLRDTHPERFEALNTEWTRWLPEYDRILFQTPSDGQRSFSLRAKGNERSIPASELSHGTLLALAILTLAYLPKPPTIATFEEPDRGIHPRLLREVRDALYRLAYPQDFGENRPPVQVVATTHSPYFLDQFKDHPEEVVISQKNGLEATFQRLSDREDLHDVLEGASLGEVWYSGILGGVPVAS